MQFTHFDQEGRAQMVDVGAKDITKRKAVAEGYIQVSEHTFAQIKAGNLAKGDVLAVAQLAGIMGAKQTSNLIPLCHNINLNGVNLQCEMLEEVHQIRVVAEVKCSGKTGVEMEALTAVSIALLTIYDMCKALQKDMVIGPVRLLAKSGGKSGDFKI